MPTISINIPFNYIKTFFSDRMSYKDFITFFHRVEICNLTASSSQKVQGRKEWNCTTAHGKWSKGVSAGGCRNYPSKYYIYNIT